MAARAMRPHGALRSACLGLVLAKYREVVIVGSVDSGDIRRCRRSSALAESTAAVRGRGTAAAAVWKPGRRRPDALQLPPGRREFSSECPVLSTHLSTACVRRLCLEALVWESSPHV